MRAMVCGNRRAKVIVVDLEYAMTTRRLSDSGEKWGNHPGSGEPENDRDYSTKEKDQASPGRFLLTHAGVLKSPS